MVSRTVLLATGITIWMAVLVTAAPRAISHRHSGSTIEVSGHRGDSPVSGCQDFNTEFNGRRAVMGSEELTISKAQAPMLTVNAEHNGGLQVEGWDRDAYSVTLCKAVEPGNNAESELGQIKLALSNGEVKVMGPAGHDRWAAHLLVKAPRGSAMDLHANNGPVGLYRVDGNLKARAVNGPITVRGCTGSLDLTAENGPVTLEENSGKQTIRTENGPIHIDLTGTNWSGVGLEAHATNGPVTLRVPAGYQSGVLLESEGHGPFSCRASVCNEGRKTWDDEHKRVEFGAGPTVVKISTVNGPVSVI